MTFFVTLNLHCTCGFEWSVVLYSKEDNEWGETYCKGLFWIHHYSWNQLYFWKWFECSWKAKPSLKIRTANTIFWISLGIYRDHGLKKRNKTFLFFKIESWNFQVQFEIKIRETSQNFNSFSLFRQLLFSSFLSVVWLSWNLQGSTKFNFKLNLKVSAFYLEKQKSVIPKKKEN